MIKARIRTRNMAACLPTALMLGCSAGGSTPAEPVTTVSSALTLTDTIQVTVTTVKEGVNPPGEIAALGLQFPGFTAPAGQSFNGLPGAASLGSCNSQTGFCGPVPATPWVRSVLPLFSLRREPRHRGAQLAAAERCGLLRSGT